MFKKNKSAVLTAIALVGLASAANAQSAITDFDSATYAQEMVDKLLAILAIVVPVIVGLIGLKIGIRFVKAWLSRSAN